MSIKLTLCLIIGIVLGLYWNFSSYWVLILLLSLLPFLYFSFKKQKRRTFPFFECLTVVTVIVLGIFTVTFSMSSTWEGRFENTKEDVIGLWELKIQEVLKPNSYSQRCITHLHSLDGSKSRGKLLLTLPLDSTSKLLSVDDELVLWGKAETIRPPLNPNSFDYKDYLAKQGIRYQIRAQPDQFKIQENPSSTLYGIASRFRNQILSNLKQEEFGKEELSVIQALVLGQRDDISEDTYKSYRDAGAVHILAVSGLHVGILLLLFQFFLSPLERLPKGKTLKLIMVVLFLWMYAFIAGLSPSIVRAVTMFSFVAYAMHLNRPTNAFNILALSMFFILLIKPLFLFQVGFQMSYAAVFAIVWLYPKLQRFWYPENIILQKSWQLMSVSIAAQLGVLPISLYYFHQFPALFFVSNLLVVPFLGLLLGMGIFVIVLSFIHALPHQVAEVYNFLIGTMNTIVAWVGKQEGFVIRDIPFDQIQMVLGYVLIIALVRTLSKPKVKNVWLLGISILMMQLWVIWNQQQSNTVQSLILANQTKQSLLLYQNGNNLNIHANDTLLNPSWIDNFKIAKRISSSKVHSLKNSYHLSQKRIFVMDSFGNYPLKSGVDYLVLTQSPKVHLGRLLDSVGPKLVLADGSNYKSYVRQWKTTCAQKEIPFQSTSEKGFYVFNLEED
ncbi:ComEC family competence protein [Flagellimonas algicola]|uniref:ComEC family competence protein n=1 Tax=Flagellimonas algicola TaxID=2583815 RepID=A0ABY2WL74_9FLAO|nr:ComEC family competence protein [Allomuricauda algicola]